MTNQRGLALAAILRVHVRQIGKTEGIMRCDGSMSSAAWRDSRQAPILLHSEKGEEKLLPTCVHGHVAKSIPLYPLPAPYEEMRLKRP